MTLRNFLIAVGLALVLVVTVFSQSKDLGIGFNLIRPMPGLTAQDLTSRTSSPVLVTSEIRANGRTYWKAYMPGSSPAMTLSTLSGYIILSPRVQTISLAPSNPPTTGTTTGGYRIVLYNGYQKVRVLSSAATVLTSATVPNIPVGKYVTDGSALFTLLPDPRGLTCTSDYNKYTINNKYTIINKYSVPSGALTTVRPNLCGELVDATIQRDGSLESVCRVEYRTPVIDSRYGSTVAVYDVYTRYRIDKNNGLVTSLVDYSIYYSFEDINRQLLTTRGGRTYKLMINNAVYQIYREDIRQSITTEPNGISGFSVNEAGTLVVYSTRTASGSELKTVNIDGSNVVQITHNNVSDYAPQFLMDGRILFWSGRLAANDVWVADANDPTKQTLFYRIGPTEVTRSWSDRWSLSILTDP